MGASFLCICPPKSIEFDQTKDNSKAEIQTRLSEVVAFHGQDAREIYCPGAGLVYIPAHDLSVTIQVSCFAAFKGRLDNYPYLVRKYCARLLDSAELPTLNQIKDAAPLSAAEVVCELYATLGTSFLPKLKGDFAFVCYDSQKSTTTAAASAALKAMKGITMAPKPPDLRRQSSSSVADVSSQSTDFPFRSSSVTRSSSMTPSAPIAIGSFRDSSNFDSLGSSMYTDTILEGSGSVTSATSMFTTKTNKTRRGKRGGKKQRENSLKFRMQSVPTPTSPMLTSSPSGSQADRKGWWRSSASDKDTSPLLQAVNAFGMDLPDDASQGDTMSSMSLGDLPMPGNTQEPPTVHGSADDAWGQDIVADNADELQLKLSSNFSGRLPTVIEHMEEGMSRPQSLADLSKAGWTVDSILLRCTSHANISRLSRISSFPDLATMPEKTFSSASSPPSAFPEYPSQRQLADLGAQMSAAFSGLSAPAPSPPTSKPSSSLNPNAASFEPGRVQSVTDQASSNSNFAQPASQPQAIDEVSSVQGVVVPPLRTVPEVVMGFALPDGGASEGAALNTVAEQDDPAGDMSAPKTPAAGNGNVDEKADKAVARRLLLKKRTPSFNKSKSCNDLAAVEPKSPSRSPFAPLAHLAQ